MSKFLFALFLILAPLALSAQTIIELKPGGGVRGKDVDDYRQEMRIAERATRDSLAYVDNLRRAFNALYADSVGEAERLFNEALKLRPNAPGNYVVRYNLALIDLSRNQYNEAITKLSKILGETPDYHAARLARAEASLRIGYAKEAINDATSILELPSETNILPATLRQARFIRAAARYEARLYTEARSDLDLLLREEPDNRNALILHSLTLFRMGRPKEALNRLNLLVSARPDDPDALTTRAEVEAELDMPGPARADYDTLIKLQPEEADHYIGRARMLIRLGEKQAARNDLDRAVSLGTPHGVVQSLYNLTR